MKHSSLICLMLLSAFWLANTQAQSASDLLSPSAKPASSEQKWDLSVLDEDDESEGIEIDFTDSATDEDFLPVDEAYRLSVNRNKNGLEIEWIIADKYYLYGEQFRFQANGQDLEASLPKGKIAFDPIFEKDVEKHYSYVKALINKDDLPALPGFQLSVRSQGCADAGLCYPPQTRIFTVDADSITPVSIAASTSTPPAAPANKSKSKIQWLVALGMLAFAIVGGMILNLMPCVLPVLSLKALSLAGNHHGNHRAQGWSYTVGVMTTFVLIAGVLLMVRAAGQSVGWGFQLQSPAFITLLILLFFVMGLSLSGYITLGARWMNTGQSLTQGSGLKASYFTGVLAAVVASPCTAPFMASALGYAISQPWWLALSIFAGLGFGMALPLLLLSYLPQLERWLPKPGAWMETFKQALAFPLYLTAIWLLWVLGQQLGNDAAAMVISACLLIIFVYWLAKHMASIQRFAGLGCLLIAAALSWQISQTPLQASAGPSDSDWETFSPQRLSDLRNEGKAVFINMTADWCITCKWNEKLVFTDSTVKAMQAKNIHLIKGDWTNYDPTITQFLEQYGRGGVPLYLLFPAKVDAKVQILPQILTPEGFNKALEAI